MFYRRRGFAPCYVAAALMAGIVLAPSLAQAAPLTVLDIFHYRDVRSANSVGIVAGDRLTFGADILPNGDNSGDGFADSDGLSPSTTVSATQGAANRAVPFRGTTEDPNRFSTSVLYNPARTGSWQLEIRNGADSVSAETPEVGIADAVPFVSNVALVVGGTTPTVAWTLPAVSGLDHVTLNFWDLGNFIGSGGLGGGGIADIVHRAVLDPDATSYAVPGGALDPNHLYSVSVQLQKRRPSVSGIAGLLSDSRAFFNFSTASLNVPGNVDAPVFLPTVDPTGASGTPVYFFSVDEVTAGQTIFVDPLVAIGYDYAVGDGDPNFASVTLPDVGDGLYELWLFDSTDTPFDTGTVLHADTPFNFEPGGVDKFRILGIETGAGLDPDDPTAFVTGFTFAGDGSFTGTMTPLTVSISEPAPLAVLGLGLVAFGFMSRKRRA